MVQDMHAFAPMPNTAFPLEETLKIKTVKTCFYPVSPVGQDNGTVSPLCLPTAITPEPSLADESDLMFNSPPDHSSSFLDEAEAAATHGFTPSPTHMPNSFTSSYSDECASCRSLDFACVQKP